MKIRTYFKEISRLNPVTPSGSKPLVPLAVSAASVIIVMLLIGFGAQNPDTPLLAAAQSDDAEGTKSKGTWRQTNGPYGGKILTLYETIDGALLAGTEKAGIFRSIDNGYSWTPVNTGLSFGGRSMDVTAISEKGNNIYVGVWNTLYFSTDIGDTWQRVPAIRTPNEIYDIVTLDDYIYVSALLTGVWQSKDGKSWTQINDGLGATSQGYLLQRDQPLIPVPSGGFALNPMPVKLASVGTKLLVAATEKGFFRRMVNEDSWTPINSTVVGHSDGAELENNSHDKQGLNPSSKQHSSYDLHVESFASIRHSLYMSGSIGENSGLFRSNDGGDSWMLITPEKAKEESDDVQTIAVQGERLYAGTYDGLIYLSEDMGDSWISINDGVMHGEVLTVLPINDNTVFIGTSRNGVFRTTDAGASWIECSTGIINTSVSKLEVIGDKLYTVVGSKIVYSVDGGDTWSPINNSLNHGKCGVKTLCASDGDLYIGAYFGDDKFLPPYSPLGGEGDSVYRLNRENDTLVELFTDKDLFQIESMNVVGNTFYMGTWESGVFQWDQNMGLTKLGLEQHHNIWLLSANSKYVIAVTGDSEIYRFKENRWDSIHSKDMIDEGLSDLKWVGSTLYATFWNKGVFRSRDGGDTWTSINDGLDDTSVTSIGTDGTEVYVCTYPNVTNVFQWIEDKQHWKSIGSLTQHVSSLAVVDGFLYAGTDGSGVYKIQIEK